MLAALPQAAALYRQQIQLGLDGNPQESQKARVILREIFGGKRIMERAKAGACGQTSKFTPQC